MTEATDAHWHFERGPRERAPKIEMTSCRVPMRDGVTLAVDVYVPRGPGVPERMPAIMRQTRYLRSLEARGVAAFLGLADQFDLYAGMRRAFAARGYAWVDVDVRGTGASTGTWHSPWFDDEIRDGAEIADFIVKQPWSSGRVGSLGISYDGTCAEMLLVNRHPAVRAVAPLFSLYDVYADIAFPGGVHLAWFTEQWSRYNAALDRNAFDEAMAIPIRLMARAALASPSKRGAEHLLARLGAMDEDKFRALLSGWLRRAFSGVRHVEAPGDGVPSAEQLALRAHNLDVHAGAQRITFRDDRGVHPNFPDRTIDAFSPHAFRGEIAESGAAIYNYSGWRDGAYQHAAIKRFTSVPTRGSRLTLGPWAHTGRLRIHAFDLGKPTRFDHTRELLDFFDAHLHDRPSAGDGAPVHYYTMGEERWKSASSWPPPGLRPKTLHFATERRLLFGAPESAGSDACDGGDGAGTGERSRWRSLLSLVPGDYPDRRDRDQRLVAYDSVPLAFDLEVTGHPLITIFASWPDPHDPQIFAYLEDARADGGVSYVTEGQLRAMHRAQVARDVGYTSPAPLRAFLRADASPPAPGEVVELTFDLLPVSHLFKKGHRVRVALAGGDADHFAGPRGRAASFRVLHGRAHPSRIVLPALER